MINTARTINIASLPLVKIFFIECALSVYHSEQSEESDYIVACIQIPRIAPDNNFTI